jgi:hypothetical protein
MISETRWEIGCAIFANFVLVILLLGDTYLQYILYALFVLFLFISAIMLGFRQIDFSSKPSISLVGWLLFLTALGVSAFFTISIPDTISSMALFFLSYAVFVWIYFLPSEYKAEKLVKFFIAIGVVLSLLSVYFYVKPVWASLLPGMNILFPAYGHNHLAAIMLLLFPPAVWS